MHEIIAERHGHWLPHKNNTRQQAVKRQPQIGQAKQSERTKWPDTQCSKYNDRLWCHI